MKLDRVKLITLMAQKDISLKDLALKTGLSTGTISSIRSGKSCKKDTAEALATGFSVTVDELLKKEA